MASPVGRVVTFYSYKGGVGRTLALANVAAQLALWGYRVLAVDWDLEAPGLDAYFRRWLPRTIDGGVLELAESFRDGAPRDWREVASQLEITGARHPLRFIAAGRQDDDYLGRVQRLDWNALYEAGFGPYLEDLRTQWTRDFDFVLVDSRTGVSDTGGICTIQLPDALVVLFTASLQSVAGIKRVARRAQEQQRKLPVDRARLMVLPVPTRVDQTEYQQMEDWYKRFEGELAPFVGEWTDEEGAVERLLRQLAIPYVPYWSYGEKLPMVDELSRDKLSVAYALETLAAVIVHDLDSVSTLLRDRDGYVRDAMFPVDASEGDRPGPDIFLSFARDDEAFALKLARALQSLGVSVWVAPEHIPAGRAPEFDTIMQALRASRHFVMLVSVSMGSWQARELELAVGRSLRHGAPGRIIPIVRRGVRGVPPAVANLQTLTEDELVHHGQSSPDVLAQHIVRLIRNGDHPSSFDTSP